MRPIVFLCALMLAACSQSPSDFPKPQNVTKSNNAAHHASIANKRPVSLSPSAPIKLTYQVEDAPVGQQQRVNLSISTRLRSGMLSVEVAKKEGADIIGDATHKIDLAAIESPIELQLQAIQLGADEHFLVLLLTVETEMGPMSRSFRIDLVPAVNSSPQ